MIRPIVVFAAATVLLAGCGSGEPEPEPVRVEASATPATPTPPTSVPVNTEPARSPATGATPAVDPADCAASELSLGLGREDGSAGSVTIPLLLTNVGTRTCTLAGFPGVSYVTGRGGTEVGAAASRSGDEGSPVTLPPGGRADAAVRAVQVLNYPADECEPTPVAGLRVYPPNATDALYAARPGTGCARYGVDQLQVTAVSGR